MLTRHILRRCTAAITLSMGLSAYPVFATDDVIKLGYTSAPQQYNPAYATQTHTTFVLSNLYETLIREGNLSGFTGGLAERWHVSDDARIYDFWIRENASWSDGTPIDATYAADSFRLLATLPDNANFIDFSQIEISVEQDDNGRDFLRFELAEPSSQFFPYLAYATSAVLPIHKAGEIDFATPWETFDAGPQVYSGPYRLVDVVENGKRMTLRPNPGYHSLPHIMNDGIELAFHNDQDLQGIQAIRGGAFDMVAHRPSSQSDFLEAAMENYIRRIDDPVIDMLLFNTDTPELQDPAVRHAIAQISILSDEAALVDVNDLLITGSFVPTQLHASLGTSIEPLKNIGTETAISEARAVMMDLGYGPNNWLEIEFSVNSSVLHERMANLMRARLHKIYIDANITVTPWTEHQMDITEGDFEIARYGWRYDIAHPANLFKIFTSESVYNFVGYANPEYDQIIAAMGQTFEEAKLAALVAEAEAIMRRDVPAIPLYQRNDSLLVNPELILGEYNFAGQMRFDQIHWSKTPETQDQS